MKKICLIGLIVGSLFADVYWMSYKDAYKVKSNGKPMLIFVGATNCGYCKKEKNNINSSEELSVFINKKMNPVYINQDKDFIPVDLISDMTPAIYFATSTGKILTKPMFGVISNEELFQYAQIIEAKSSK